MNLIMVVTMGVVVGVCLFPIWPQSAKVVIFYVSLYLLYFLLGISVIRLVIWGVLRIFGLDFWLFPNLNADVGPLESFRPLYECNSTEDDWAEYVGRLLGLVIVIYLVLLLKDDPSIVDEYQSMGE